MIASAHELFAGFVCAVEVACVNLKAHFDWLCIACNEITLMLVCCTRCSVKPAACEYTQHELLRMLFFNGRCHQHDSKRHYQRKRGHDVLA